MKREHLIFCLFLLLVFINLNTVFAEESYSSEQKPIPESDLVDVKDKEPNTDSEELLNLKLKIQEKKEANKAPRAGKKPKVKKEKKPTELPKVKFEGELNPNVLKRLNACSKLIKGSTEGRAEYNACVEETHRMHVSDAENEAKKEQAEGERIKKEVKEFKESQLVQPNIEPEVKNE